MHDAGDPAEEMAGLLSLGASPEQAARIAEMFRQERINAAATGGNCVYPTEAELRQMLETE